MGLRALILSIFLYGQIGTTAHAHEHEDETDHSVCEFCILAHTDEELTSDELDDPDLSDGSDNVLTPASIERDSCEVQLDLTRTLYVLPKLTQLRRYLDAARAPPFNHKFIVEQI